MIDKRIISDELKEQIRSEVKKRKSKAEVSKIFGIPYGIVRYHARDIPVATSKPITIDVIKKIRSEVAAGKTKYQISKELGLSYYIVKYHTLDLSIIKNELISIELLKKIRSEVAAGKSKKQVAKELNLSYDAVRNRTRDIKTTRKISDEQIAQIRQCVLKYRSKSEAARKLGYSCWKIERYSKDIHFQKERISTELRDKIRKEVQSGKPKMQIARELNLPPKIIYCHTTDIITGQPRNAGITGTPLKLLVEIMEKGYAVSPKKYPYYSYQKLRKRFHNIRRVKMYGVVIYFMRQTADAAMRAFLEITDKKIISGQELQQIIDVFKANASKRDKMIGGKRKK